MTKPHYWDDAARVLAARDPVLGTLIAAYPGLHLIRRGDPFTTLARAIVGQQISVKAAQAIWERLVAACGGTTGPKLDPSRVARKRVATLRACGLSGGKPNTSAISRSISSRPGSTRTRGRRSATRR